MGGWASQQPGARMFDMPPDIGKQAAPIAGAVSALLFLRDHTPGWLRRLGWAASRVATGTAISYYIGPDVADWFEVRETTSGFVTGLLGVFIFNRVISTIDAIDLGDIVRRALEKWLGLEPRRTAPTPVVPPVTPDAPTRPADL